MAEGLRLTGLVIEAGARRLVDGVSLHLRPGRITVLVGSSGSGKTLTARSLLGMVPPRPGVVAGELEIEVEGRVLRPFQQGFQDVRGALVGYLAQDAPGSLDPLWTIGRQVREALALAGRPLDPLPWLRRAGLPEAERVAELFAHELSGGMAQRATIALSLARGSRYLVADEPTTGLDPTVQEGILAELIELKERGVGILFITHDLRLVPRLADHLLVLHQGRLVEDLPADQLSAISSPEAKALWDATARISGGLLR
jgi:peptide/nickel transport system ATP-binding protein